MNGSSHTEPLLGRGRTIRLIAVLVAGMAVFGAIDEAWSAGGGRHALVIGNARYTHLASLQNPEPDSALLTAALERRGFSVQRVVDADYEGMRTAINDFRATAADAEVALIYFAGHGVQVDGVNYLFPVDAEVGSRVDLQQQSINLPFLLHELETVSPGLGILVLDACRDNPIAALESALEDQPGRSLAPRKGLAPSDSPTGLIVAYATAPGQIARDGDPGGNSPFAAALAHFLDEPGLEIGLLFRKVSARVREMTAGAQVPWVEAALGGEPVVLHDLPSDGLAGSPNADPITALNLALDQSDPLQLRAALAIVAQAHAGAPAAALAGAYLAELEAADSAADADAPGLEVALVDRQRVELLAGGPAEGFASELFTKLHGGASSSVGQEQLALAGTHAPLAGDDAASLLWPLVEASRRTDDFARFLGLFPDAAEAKSAAAGLQLASLDLSALQVLGDPAAQPPPAIERVPVVIGTGSVRLPLPATDAPLVVTEPPRHGTLEAFDARGVALALDSAPLVPAELVYRPPVVMRSGVDQVTLTTLGTASDATLGAARSLDSDASYAVEAAVMPSRSITVQLEISVDACDREAGIRFDRQAVVLGKFPEEVLSERAVPACEAAVARFPDVARFHFQLGIAIDLGGDPDAAIASYRAAAVMGHWFAVNRLGFLHLTGRGLPVDFAKARSLFEIAAGQGDSHAMNNLGRAYLAGEIVPADRDEAIAWLQEAAALGNSFAYNSLGTMLLDEGDPERALPLFRQASAAGDIYGYNNLGWLYQNGIGVEADLEQAIEWYERAARSGQPNAPINLGFLYRDGAPALAPDRQRAAFWFAEAAKGGNPWGTVHLAALYQAGDIGGGPDPALAAKLLARVAWIDAETGREAAQKSYGGAGDVARERFALLPVRVVAAAVQSELSRLGFDPGPVDGLPGPRTEAAIEAFASSRDLALPLDLPPIDLLAELVQVSAG